MAEFAGDRKDNLSVLAREKKQHAKPQRKKEVISLMEMTLEMRVKAFLNYL